jgi:hypothetical protein
MNAAIVAQPVGVCQYEAATRLHVAATRARWFFVESPSRSIFLFEHDLRANASRLSRGKTGTHFSASCSSRKRSARGILGIGPVDNRFSRQLALVVCLWPSGHRAMSGSTPRPAAASVKGRPRSGARCCEAFIDRRGASLEPFLWRPRSGTSLKVGRLLQKVVWISREIKVPTGSLMCSPAGVRTPAVIRSAVPKKSQALFAKSPVILRRSHRVRKWNRHYVLLKS